MQDFRGREILVTPCGNQPVVHDDCVTVIVDGQWGQNAVHFCVRFGLALR